jgi:alpha-L-arabinofuranosidase
VSSVITVDASRSLGDLDRRIYGGFIEHLGRCIYGGIYDEGSRLSDENGVRTDVISLLRDLELTVLRWPGGNFVSNYHWKDGIGSKDLRPARPDLAWGAVDSNRFGTDEFIEYCRALHVEPYICLNMGTGTLEEALDWIEYCNSALATYWAGQRKDNGHSEAYKVPWWGLGNEMYGDWQVGALSAEEYVAEATRWARAIKRLDPSARLVACGESGWSDWDVKVVDGLVSLVDLYSVHLYTGSDDYWTNVLQPYASQRAISTASALLRRAAYEQHLGQVPRIAYDEWNVWFRTDGGTLAEVYNFSDALAVGLYLNIFVRNCAWVAMANLAQMVNVIAPVVTTPDTAVVQPIYYPFLLHAKAHRGRAIDAWVEGPTVEAPKEHLSRWPHRVDDLGPFTLVDAAATHDVARQRIALTLVNRSEKPERAEVMLVHHAFSGAANMTCATASGQLAGPGGVEGTNIETGEVKPTGATGGGKLVLDLPARSFTMVESGIDEQ